ncbi:MAG: thioesterase family protein [Desulfohalobiaceae bacterium]|nr:thioesterase family protein [Desulfohalobiaceae bacterium]
MTSTDSLQPGLTGEAKATVGEEDLARQVGSGDVAVYATPRLAALMEGAAIAAVKGVLPAEKTTVGARLDLSHLAPTPAGSTVRAEARLEEVDSKKLRFRITAFDEREKIGEASHERIVVDRNKFTSRAEEKAKS